MSIVALVTKKLSVAGLYVFYLIVTFVDLSLQDFLPTKFNINDIRKYLICAKIFRIKIMWNSLNPLKKEGCFINNTGDNHSENEK